MRAFRSFSFKDTNLRVACGRFDELTGEIVARRRELERYIRRHPAFRDSLVPLALLPDAPEAALRMARAADPVGVGPMAGVAGALAQLGAEKALSLGAGEAIVENGGDLYIASGEPVTVGIWSGDGTVPAIAFALEPADLPLSVCSSSSRMGHSHSFGNCDLATAVAEDAALADCAATALCNAIRSVDDLEGALNKVGAVPGIAGLLAVVDGRVGLWGNLPRLIRSDQADIATKITRDRRSR